MATIKEIKSRIKGVRDTQKITGAMHLIASTKLRKAKNDLERTRPYFDALQQEINRIFPAAQRARSRYFRPADCDQTPGERCGCLIITADRGLAGAYNQGVIKQAQRLLSKRPGTKLFVMGDYGRRFFSRRGMPIERFFLHAAQNPTMDKAREINAVLLGAFERGELDRIDLIYTDTKNSLTTLAVADRLLPFEQVAPTQPPGHQTASMPFEFFPSMEAVFDQVAQSCLSGFIYSALVASFCSEQSARMAAMNAANQNAEEILELLTLQYNRVRQAAITQEITEISSGARAQKRKRTKEVSPI
jgi:F-type H+-transporting ATPase subunit gamma